MPRNLVAPTPVAGTHRSSRRRIGRERRQIGVILAIALLVGAGATPALATTTLPVLWTAGGLSSGYDSAGQAARIASDASGNVAVVSGPALGYDLAVTSYTASGSFRWRSTVSPTVGTITVGTMAGGWVVAAPNGDFVAVGYNVDSHGYPRASTLVRYASDGTLRWRVDLGALVSRLVVDAGGNTYLTFGAQDIQLQKYNASGVLVWESGATGNFNTSSLALSPDQADVVLTGSSGGAWITAAFNTATGARKWQVTAAEGISTSDVVVDATRVYVTGEGNVGIYGFLTVVAYDRATGARLWRTDANPPTCCAIGDRIALAPDGSLVVAGHTATGGYFNWWTVAMNTNGAVRWQALRDATATAGDEIPAAVFVLADGTTVVSGTGGPVTRDVLGNSYMQGVTAGYGPNGTLLWEAFSKLRTVWATALPNGDVCATGGYDALVTCWRVPSPPPPPAVSLQSLGLNPTQVSGGSPSAGTVALSSAAPSGGLVVTVASSNPSVAGVPASVTVAQGATSASFSIATTSVSVSTIVTISATSAGLTRTASLTVTPPATADTVAITLAQYRASGRKLSVGATSTSASATLTVYVSATGQSIGTLANNGGGNYSAQFSWPSNPQNITVRSSLGGSASKAVTRK